MVSNVPALWLALLLCLGAAPQAAAAAGIGLRRFACAAPLADAAVSPPATVAAPTRRATTRTGSGCASMPPAYLIGCGPVICVFLARLARNMGFLPQNDAEA